VDPHKCKGASEGPQKRPHPYPKCVRGHKDPRLCTFFFCVDAIRFAIPCALDSPIASSSPSLFWWPSSVYLQTVLSHRLGRAWRLDEAEQSSIEVSTAARSRAFSAFHGTC